MAFFSKVSKMGDKLWILVPLRYKPDFKPGDPVWIKRVEPPPPEAEDV